MEMNHFDHDHPLIFSDELDGCSVPCNVCSHRIIGLAYSCNQCPFVLHKWCSELPRETTIERFDEKHSVTLQKTLPAKGSSSSFSPHFTCDMCHNDGFGYAYRCSDSDCAFITHVECGWSRSMRDIGFMYDIKGKRCRFDYHWPGPELDRLYTCNACGNRGSGPRLECDENNKIVFHIQCSKLPETAKHVIHLHTLSLSTVTDVIENKEEEFICDACEDRRNPRCWVYCCPEAECVIRIHINCAIVPIAVQDNWSSRLVYFVRNNPMYESAWFNNPHKRNQIKTRRRASEWEANLAKINREIKEASEREDKRKEERSREAKDKAEFVHFDHEHPLKPYDEPFLQYGDPCLICMTPIYGKTFGCKDCGYFIHKWCSNLQQKIRHPLHEHQLSLEPSPHLWKCGLCDSTRGLGMNYTCLKCNFNLEVLCASLPENLNHKLDKHTLTPLKTTLDERLFGYLGEKFAKRLGDLPRCNACGFPCEDLSVECKKCNLHLHIHCFLLPVTGKHPSHRHELVLSLPPDIVDPNADLDEFICDACEENRDPENWVYRCPKCDYLFAAHVNCAASPKLVVNSVVLDELQCKIEDFRLDDSSYFFEHPDQENVPIQSDQPHPSPTAV
ncbi:uncharacterized protein LOC124934125 isoform X2 [Impatiens glandulifera]|uniref:uncharacterized protein LOC124934125 isoform X2 n=1 Tax=Impatiens glandulifera TaxID=253017 RepID=UPI001FB0A366|nr:uncharacterized protein LOC124934125 isoform X2 [Impatiens glandulifera]XP_047330554.1 uncharacterized protein LOC124934125 isoform X2 [Impatiens glandulifera]XP_047330556.1 uncharacterized protein LOC124934125 isoform X2 [Impatiens glandulifera]